MWFSFAARFVEIARVLRAAHRDTTGASAIEYALIAALVAVAIIGALGLMGVSLQGLFEGIAGDLADATPASEE